MDGLIQSQRALDALRWNSNLIGVDHEFHFRETYKPIPSLVQLASVEQIVAVDLLAGLDLTNVKTLMQNKAIEFVCHDSTSEFPLLRQVFGILPTAYCRHATREELSRGR